MNSYKLLLVLSYFNSVYASYSYKEISEIFGLTSEQVENVINQLYEEKLLNLNKFYQITNKGKNLLKQNDLDTIDIFEDNNDESIFINSPIDFSDIYIPDNFTKKIK